MSSRVYECPCGKTISFSNGSRLGEFAKKTGWTPVLVYSGSIVRLCPQCAEKAKTLAKQLTEVMGTSDFIFRVY